MGLDCTFIEVTSQDRLKPIKIHGLPSHCPNHSADSEYQANPGSRFSIPSNDFRSSIEVT
jgi:hypothetical protein